jgi:anti-sigma B factor antagonist
MDINVREERGITVLELSGELTGRSAPDAMERILEQARPEGAMILDMSRVPFMSSAGLRVLLIVHRRFTGADGRIVLVGVSEDIRDSMEFTGFLEFFTVRGSLEEGIAALAP